MKTGGDKSRLPLFLEYELKYEKIRSRSDAFLVISLQGAGFFEPACTASSVNDCPGFVPTISVVAILVDHDKKTILYRGFHSTGILADRPRMLFGPKGVRETPHEVSFENFNALLANPEATTQALMKGAWIAMCLRSSQ